MDDSRVDRIVCFSAGLDSLMAWFWANKYEVGPTHLIFFKSSHVYESKEYFAVRNIARCLGFKVTTPSSFLKSIERDKSDNFLIIDTTFDFTYTEDKETFYIPYRNMYFLSKASVFGKKVIMGGIKGDLVEDNNPQAYEIMQKCFTTITPYDVELVSYFWDMTKVQIVKWFLEEEITINSKILSLEDKRDLIRFSVSCYSPEINTKCGKCKSCFRRWVALENNNLEDKWVVNPWESDLIPYYLERFEQGLYDKIRVEETLLALQKRGIVRKDLMQD